MRDTVLTIHIQNSGPKKYLDVPKRLKHLNVVVFDIKCTRVYFMLLYFRTIHVYDDFIPLSCAL